MDTNNQKPTKNAGNVSNSPSSRLSAEDKLKRSLKNLSHTGGMGGGDLNRSSLNSSYTKSSIDSSRKKVGGVVLDIETIEDATKQKLDTRGKRNNIIIFILTLALVMSLVFLVISIMAYKNGKKPPNCRYTIEGDADARWLIQGSTKTKFRLKQGLEPDTIYLVNSTLDIKSTESVMVTIEIEVLLDGQPIPIFGLQDSHQNLVRIEGTNQYVYQGTITGGGKFVMFEGIDFSEAPGKLTSDSVKIKVTANINKI